MNVKLIRAWIDAGSPPLEDLAPMLGTVDIYLIRYMAGKSDPDEGIKEALSDVFNQPVEELFPEEN